MSLFTPSPHPTTSSKPKPNTNTPPNTPQGFTIVELLIVIVVIAILAAISIVSYNGIQQRAKNTAIINAASQSIRVIEAYIATTGTYPLNWSQTICITTDVGCATTSIIGDNASVIASVMSKIEAVGNLPKSVPKLGKDNYYGIWMTYNSSQTFNGESRPLRLTYYLSGVNQGCGVDSVTSYSWPNFTSVSSGYTDGNADGTGNTLCWISLPGPAHSS